VSAAVAGDVVMVVAGYMSARENSYWALQQGLVSGLACQWSQQGPYWPCRSCLMAEVGGVWVHALEGGHRSGTPQIVDFGRQGALMCGIEWC
jgi:hypothetical protein